MSAVIEINLVPGAERRGPSNRKASTLKMPSLPAFGGDSKAPLFAAGGVLVLLLAVYALWNLGATHARLEAQVQQEVTDSTRFAGTIELIQSLQARQDTMQLKIGIIAEVDQRRYVWPHLLDEVSEAVPAYTWLTRINALAPADTLDSLPGLAVQGNAGSTQALTRFMKNLEGSPFIRDVTLVTSEQIDQEGRTVHRFTLEARYQTPDSSVIATVPIVTVP